MITLIEKLLGVTDRPYWLAVPYKEENEGLLLLGDPGTGKSQIMHQLLYGIARRKQFEAVVIYDPVGEFLEHHYNPETDIILNPLDARSPYWNPALEVGDDADEIQAAVRLFIAECYFPDHPHTPPTSQFFNKGARSIFARLLAEKPSPEQLVYMLSSAPSPMLTDRTTSFTTTAKATSTGEGGRLCESHRYQPREKRDHGSLC